MSNKACGRKLAPIGQQHAPELGVASKHLKPRRLRLSRGRSQRQKDAGVSKVDQRRVGVPDPLLYDLVEGLAR